MPRNEIQLMISDSPLTGLSIENSKITNFVRMTGAKVQDKKFLAYLVLESGRFIVVGKVYSFFWQYAS